MGFLESNPVTAALLQRLQENSTALHTTGGEAVTTVLKETIGSVSQEAMTQGLATLARLQQLDIIAGVRE